MADLLGIGLYSVSEAAYLTKVSYQRIKRWVQGYEFKTPSGEWHRSDPVWRPQLEETGELLLTFLDLMEVRFVDAFLQKGISWNVIRRSAERAREEFGVTHPFSTKKVLVSGRRLFTQVARETGEPAVMQLTDGQFAFRRIIEPFLHGIDFKNDQTERWWPMGPKRRVVIDPNRSLGRPIEAQGSVPTRVLASAYRAEESYARVARWYEIDVRSVRDAVEYEARLAA